MLNFKIMFLNPLSLYSFDFFFLIVYNHWKGWLTVFLPGKKTIKDKGGMKPKGKFRKNECL